MWRRCALYTACMPVALIFRSVFAIFLIVYCVHPAYAIPTFDAVKRDFQPSDTLVLGRDGEVLQRVRTDASVRRGQWVALADVSPALRHALLLSEDKRFYEHSGVDWQAVSAAAWANLWNQRTRGASTITMQLAGLQGGAGRPAGGRSLLQKAEQTLDATRLERSWRKDQILEAYLNLVPFRGELVGIDALSRTLFGKAAHGLDAREAAVAAALVRGPNAKVPQITQRACGVLAQIGQVRAVEQAGQLHRQGAGTARALVPKVAPGSGRHRLPVHPAVLVKAPVFTQHQRRAQCRRHVGQFDPLSTAHAGIGAHALQHLALAVQHQGVGRLKTALYFIKCGYSPGRASARSY